MSKDPYQILGISRKATADDVQKAYRQAARKYHPDLNPDDEQAKKKFQEVQSAYEILNDPDKRKMYDRYGSSFEQMNGAGSAGAGGNPFQDIDLGEIFGSGQGGAFADLFKHFADGGAQGQRRRSKSRKSERGTDIHHSIMISFHDAVLGGEVPFPVVDPDGSSKTITVKVPAGVTSGQKIRVRGQGNAGSYGGEDGDLILTVSVGGHPHFRRNGKNLEVSVPVTVGEAATGAKVDVPTPKGTVSVTVPAKAKGGQRLRVRGMGVETTSGEKGDLIVEIQIVLPVDLTDVEVEILRQMDENRQQQPRADLKW